MPDFTFNIALGRGHEWFNRVKSNDPATSALGMTLFTGAITQATLQDLDSIQAIENDAAAAEATFTGYARILIDDTDLAAFAFAPDDANNRFDVDLPDLTWTPSGPTETITWGVLGYDNDTTAGNDSNILPWLGFDVNILTDNPIDWTWNAAGAARAEPAP